MKFVKSPPGEFLTEFLTETMSKSYFDEDLPKCKKCPNGTKTNGFSKLVCKKGIDRCPSKTIEDVDGDCISCDYNHRAERKKKKCIKCPSNIVSRGVSKKYKSCGFDRIATKTGVCRSKRGTTDINVNCDPCPAGTHGWDVDIGFPCRVEFTSTAGLTSCTRCKPGTGTRGPDHEKCVPNPNCKPGFIFGKSVYTEYKDVDCLSASTGCPPRLKIASGKARDSDLCQNEKGEMYCPKGAIYDGLE